MVILCFEKRFSKQNRVIRLKSNSFAPKIFGLATPLALYMFDDRGYLFGNSEFLTFRLTTNTGEVRGSLLYIHMGNDCI